MRRSWLPFQGLLEHAAVERQLGDHVLETADFVLEFYDAKSLILFRILLSGISAAVGGQADAALAARLVDIQPGLKIGLDLAEDRGDLVRSGSSSPGLPI